MATRICVHIAVSMDGYIADVDGASEALTGFAAVRACRAAFLERVDVVVMGQRTFGRGAAELLQWLEGRRCYVLSVPPEASALPAHVHGWTDGVESLAAHLREVVEDGDVWVEGGGKAIASFIEAEEVDRVELCMVPVLLGGGIPLLSGLSGARRFELESCRSWPEGVVSLAYRRV